MHFNIFQCSFRSNFLLFSFPSAAVISSPESNFKLTRNPRYKTAGNFMKLADFLAFAKDKDLSGILISVQVRIFSKKHFSYRINYTFVSV